MANITVRVELHEADDEPQAYKDLHAAMERQGFSRTIKTQGDVRRKLPNAEYSMVTNLTKQQVLDKAILAARSVMGDDELFSILVTRDESPRLYHNLDPAR